MTNKQLEQYLLQSLNMALGSKIQGETSYTQSFDCKVGENGFLFIRFNLSHFRIKLVLLLGKATSTCTLSAQEISTPFITSIYSLHRFLGKEDTNLIAIFNFSIPDTVLWSETTTTDIFSL